MFELTFPLDVITIISPSLLFDENYEMPFKDLYNDNDLCIENMTRC